MAMAQMRTHGSPQTRVAAGIVLGMLAMVVVPAPFTLRPVIAPAELIVGSNPSAYGYTYPAPVRRAHRDDCILVSSQRGFGAFPPRFLADHLDSGSGRVGAGCCLGRDLGWIEHRACPPVFLPSQSSSYAWTTCSCHGSARSDRRICLLSHRLHHNAFAVCLPQRMLAGRL